MALICLTRADCPGLINEEFRFRIQKFQSGSWQFFDDYVYDLDHAIYLWRRIDAEGYRVVKISWANTSVVHSIVKVK
jgi:hypothetical protein